MPADLLSATPPESAGSPSPAPSTHGAPPPLAPAPAHTPDIQELTDETLVRWAGSKEPIKYGELSKRLQADQTRKTQAIAQQRKAFEAERAAALKEVNAEKARIQGLATQLLKQQQGTQGTDLYAALAERPYVTGAEMAQIVKAIQEHGFGTVVKAIEERDQIIQGMYQNMLKLQQALGTLHGERAETSFDGKIQGWLKDANIPVDAADWAKRLYLAYEGDDLDEEFPTILREAWEADGNLHRGLDRKKVEAARTPKFPIPGKGGNGVAGKLAGLTGRETAKETTDYLWDLVQGGAQT